MMIIITTIMIIMIFVMIMNVINTLFHENPIRPCAVSFYLFAIQPDMVCQCRHWVFVSHCLAYLFSSCMGMWSFGVDTKHHTGFIFDTCAYKAALAVKSFRIFQKQSIISRILPYITFIALSQSLWEAWETYSVCTLHGQWCEKRFHVMASSRCQAETKWSFVGWAFSVQTQAHFRENVSVNTTLNTCRPQRLIISHTMGWCIKFGWRLYKTSEQFEYHRGCQWSAGKSMQNIWRCGDIFA